VKRSIAAVARAAPGGVATTDARAVRAAVGDRVRPPAYGAFLLLIGLSTETADERSPPHFV